MKCCALPIIAQDLYIHYPIFEDHYLPQSLWKPNYSKHEFSPLANGVYFEVIIDKTKLHNGNCPITRLRSYMLGLEPVLYGKKCPYLVRTQYVIQNYMPAAY